MNNGLSFGTFGAFDGNNMGAIDPNLTTTYYDVTGELAVNSKGQPLYTSVGVNSSYPLGLFPENAHALFNNTKCMFYSVTSAGFTAGASNNSNSGNWTQGILSRIITDTASTYGRKFSAIAGIGGARSSTDNICIDFTSSFFKLTSASNSSGLTNYLWLPKITFSIAAGGTSVSIGQTGDDPVYFNDFQPSINYSLWLNISVQGSIDTAGYATISETERYDEISFKPYVASAGSVITIYIPPTDSGYDSPGQRTGFADLYSIQFNGADPITAFTTYFNKNGVADTVQVTVPSGATTGPIKFRANYSSTNKLMYDLYQTIQSLVIT